MQVLDHEQHGALLGESLEQREQRLEDARLRGLAARCALAETGQHRSQRGPQRVGQGVQGRIAVAKQRPEGAEQRRVGQLALAELDAVAGEHERVERARAADQLIDEAGLADAGLAGYENQGRAPVGRVVQRGLQLGELAGAPHEVGACHPGGHFRMTIFPPHAVESGAEARRPHQAFAYMGALEG